MALFLEYRQSGNLVSRGKFSNGEVICNELVVTLNQAVKLAITSGNLDRNLRDWTLRIESDR